MAKWYAICNLPRLGRPHYKATGSGRTEEEALLDLAARLVRLVRSGAPQHGEITTYRDGAPA
jgi:hypothetical protein